MARIDAVAGGGRLQHQQLHLFAEPGLRQQSFARQLAGAHRQGVELGPQPGQRGGVTGQHGFVVAAHGSG